MVDLLDLLLLLLLQRCMVIILQNKESIQIQIQFSNLKKKKDQAICNWLIQAKLADRTNKAN